METRAHFVLIGAFTLAVLLGAMGFILWTAKDSMTDKKFQQYDIYFNSTVAGLSVAGDVLFNGIKVGQVSEITIDNDNPAQVLVRINIRANTPIREDSAATLEPRGITGVVYIQITGGTPGSPMLKPKDDDDIPVIQSQPSPLEELMATAPQLLNEGVMLLGRLNDVMDESNRQNLKDIIHNIKVVSDNFVEQSGRVGGVLDTIEDMAINTKNATKQLSLVLAQAGGVVNKADSLIDNTNQVITQDVAETVRAINKLTDNLNTLLVQVGPDVDAFAEEGLVQLTRFLGEAQQLLRTVDRVLQRFESDPDKFFFGRQIPETKAQ